MEIDHKNILQELELSLEKIINFGEETEATRKIKELLNENKNISLNELEKTLEENKAKQFTWKTNEVSVIKKQKIEIKEEIENKNLNDEASKKIKRKTGRICDNKSSYVFQLKNSNVSLEWMDEEANAISNFYNDYVEILSEMIKEKCPEQNEYEISPVGILKHNDVLIFGRICNENERNLLENSVIIEGSYQSSAGKTAQLWLNHVQEYALFPGKVVGCVGICECVGNEAKFYAQKILQGFLPNEPTLKKDELDKISSNYNGYPLHICCGAGIHFTSDEHFPSTKSPLENLLQYATEEIPHVVCIFGPLVDIRILMKKDLGGIGHVNDLYKKIFEKIGIVAEKISKTKIVVVPHPYDVLNFHPICQPEFESSLFFEETFPHKNVFFATNPATLKVNEIVIAITSCDVLSSIDKTIISKGKKCNRIELLCQQILEQNTFFPVFPSEFPIGLSDANSIFFEDANFPHIFIFPSNYRKNIFVQEVSSRIFIKAYSIGNVSNAEIPKSFVNIFINPPFLSTVNHTNSTSSAVDVADEGNERNMYAMQEDIKVKKEIIEEREICLLLSNRIEVESVEF